MRKGIVISFLIIKYNLLLCLGQTNINEIGFETDGIDNKGGFYGWVGYIGSEKTGSATDGIFASPPQKKGSSYIYYTWPANWHSKPLYKSNENNYPEILPNSDFVFETNDKSYGIENVRFARIFNKANLSNDDLNRLKTISVGSDGILRDKLTDNKIKLISPNGSEHIIRLGNSDIRYHSEKLAYTFKITNETKYIRYDYALVLEDPQHDGRPYFYAEVTENNDGCSNVFYFASNSEFKDLEQSISKQYFYRDWKANLIDLSADSLMGKEVTLTFTTSDCAAGGHGGYAYIDVMFVNSTINILEQRCVNNSLTISCSATGIYNDETYEWNFGDGTVSYDENPTHIYKTPGEYDIRLIISSPYQCNGQERIIKQKIEVRDCETSCPNGTILFKEDFGGNDPNDPPIKPTGIPQCTYTYSSDPRGPGLYSIRKEGQSHGSWWYRTSDHTYPNDITRGYMMQVDGSTSSAVFYSHQIDNLCPGSLLYFSLWGMSAIQSGSFANANLKLVIESATTHNVLAEKNIILENLKGYWEQFGMAFNLPLNETSVIFKIKNNSVDYGGNDFLLDDIEIRLCMPPVYIRPATVCVGESHIIRSDFSNGGTFDEPLEYRWLKSSTGDLSNQDDWQVIGGNSAEYNISSATQSDEGYYRLAIASRGGADRKNCRAMSDPVLITVENCDPGTPPCKECPTSFSPIPGKKYVLSAWVKEANKQDSAAYKNSSISLIFKLSHASEDFELSPFKPEGSIIDGWQRIQEEFTVPKNAVKMKIKLNNNSDSNDVFFDDIRVFPFNGNMKSYVYDPVNLRLVSELDDENYATIYEYDEEGALIRVKKETEKGIMTIREAHQAKQKNIKIK